jgi:hypothetical protein
MVLAKDMLFLFLIRHPPYVTHIVKSGVIVIDNITCRKLSLYVYSILSYLLRTVVYSFIYCRFHRQFNRSPR